jgi:hypothetical protein
MSSVRATCIPPSDHTTRYCTARVGLKKTHRISVISPHPAMLALPLRSRQIRLKIAPVNLERGDWLLIGQWKVISAGGQNQIFDFECQIQCQLKFTFDLDLGLSIGRGLFDSIPSRLIDSASELGARSRMISGSACVSSPDNANQ